MKCLRIEPYSGLSGDMWLGALVGLTGQKGLLNEIPRALQLSGISVEIKEVTRGGLRCSKVDITECSESPFRKLSDILNLIDSGSFSERVTLLSKKIFDELGFIYYINWNYVTFRINPAGPEYKIYMADPRLSSLLSLNLPINSESIKLLNDFKKNAIPI